MSDIRRSLISSTPVIIATERAMRPDDFARKKADAEEGKEAKVCPFCPGNEELTAKPELVRMAEPGRQWTLRVVPNKYPAATPEERSHFMVEPAESIVITNVHGAHEVLIETEVHEEDMSQIPVWKIFNLLQVTIDRMDTLYTDKQIRFVQVFKNFGADAGASLEHPHWQLIALPYEPEKINNRMRLCHEHWYRRGKDPFQETIEHADGHKLVIKCSKHFICYAPYDSKVPFEMTIMPLEAATRLKDSRADFQELAILTSSVFQALARVLKYMPPFNLVLEEAPPYVYCRPEDFFRWRLRSLPRLTKIAGFEFGTGYYINPLPPERTAEALKRASA